MVTPTIILGDEVKSSSSSAPKKQPKRRRSAQSSNDSPNSPDSSDSPDSPIVVTDSDNPVKKRGRPKKRNRSQSTDKTPNNSPKDDSKKDAKKEGGAKKQTKKQKKIDKGHPPNSPLGKAYITIEKARNLKNAATEDLKKGKEMLEEAKKMMAEAEMRISKASENKREASKALDNAVNEAAELKLSETNNWNEMYRRLEGYVQMYGHCLLGSQQVKREEDDPELVTWVEEQRKLLKKASLSKDCDEKDDDDPVNCIHRVLLDKLGFCWDAHDASWRRNYKELVVYKEKYGDCNIPPSKQEDPRYRHLFNWSMKQRKFYSLRKRGMRGHETLTPEREKLMVELGYDLERHPAKWMNRYNELKAYKEKFGDCRVPQKYAGNPQLGVWLRKQMEHYRTYELGLPSQMTAERVQLLNEIGIEWQRAARRERRKKAKKNDNENNVEHLAQDDSIPKTNT